MRVVLRTKVDLRPEPTSGRLPSAYASVAAPGTQSSRAQRCGTGRTTGRSNCGCGGSFPAGIVDPSHEHAIMNTFLCRIAQSMLNRDSDSLEKITSLLSQIT